MYPKNSALRTFIPTPARSYRNAINQHVRMILLCMSYYSIGARVESCIVLELRHANKAWLPLYTITLSSRNK